MNMMMYGQTKFHCKRINSSEDNNINTNRFYFIQNLFQLCDLDLDPENNTFFIFYFLLNFSSWWYITIWLEKNYVVHNISW